MPLVKWAVAGLATVLSLRWSQIHSNWPIKFDGADSVQPGTPHVGPTPEVLPRLFQCFVAQTLLHTPSSEVGERASNVVRSVRLSCLHISNTIDGWLFDVSTFSPAVQSSDSIQTLAAATAGAGAGAAVFAADGLRKRTEVSGFIEEAGDIVSPLLHRTVVLLAPAGKTARYISLCMVGKTARPVIRRWCPATVLLMPALHACTLKV